MGMTHLKPQRSIAILLEAITLLTNKETKLILSKKKTGSLISSFTLACVLNYSTLSQAVSPGMSIQKSYKRKYNKLKFK